MAVGTDSFPFQKCIIHNIQTQKIWYYFDTCLRVPFNRWQHSRGRRGRQAIDLNDTRGLLQLELTVFLPKMHYTQYPDSENMVLCCYMPPSTLQPVGAQPGPSGLTDN